MGSLNLTYKPDDTKFDDGSAFEKIKQLVEPESTVRFDQSATAITDLLPGAPAADSSDELWSVWNLFIAVAKQIPYRNPAMLRLVRLLGAMSRSPKTTGKMTGPNGKEAISVLHTLGYNLRDELSLAPYQDGNTATQEAVSSWLNLNAFMALLLTHNLVDSRQFALWQLRQAFETQAGSSEEFVCQVQAGAIWVLNAGQAIMFLSEEQGDLSPDDERAMRPGPLFEGRPGFNLQRWAWWRQQLQDAEGKLLDGDGKVLVRDAASLMTTLGQTRLAGGQD